MQTFATNECKCISHHFNLFSNLTLFIYFSKQQMHTNSALGHMEIDSALFTSASACDEVLYVHKNDSIVSELLSTTL